MKWFFRVLMLCLLLTVALISYTRRDEFVGIAFGIIGPTDGVDFYLMTDSGESVQRVNWDFQTLERVSPARYVSPSPPQRDGYDNLYESPDGEWIYARPTDINVYSMHRIHVETGHVEALPIPGNGFSQLSWSEDGSRIVMVLIDIHDQLFHISVDGSTPQTISDGLPPNVSEPRFSPDGDWIAFIGYETFDEFSIYRVRPDGGELERIIRHGGNVSDLQWSPDGEWLLYEVNYDVETDIFRLRADGSNPQNLTPGRSYPTYPRYLTHAEAEWNPALLIVAVLVIFAVRMVTSRIWP